MKTDKKIIQARYREKHREELRLKNLVYKERNKEKVKEAHKKYKAENKDKIAEYNERTKQMRYENGVKYRTSNKEKIANVKKEYYESNKDRIKSHYNGYKKERKKNDKLFYLKEKMRNIVYKSLIYKSSKNSRTENIIGCSFEELKIYLESKFEPWMNWNNQGLYKSGEINYGWDIDHIIPLSSANNDDEILKLNHYTNLQPLCSYVNRYVKRNK